MTMKECPSKVKLFSLDIRQDFKEHQALKRKLDGFLKSLESHRQEDIENNSTLLSEIIESFSQSFGSSPQAIISSLADGQPVNLESLRRGLLMKMKGK